MDTETVILSPSFEVVIPQSIRDALQLAPGEMFQVLRQGDRVELIPVRTMEQMRGFARGMDTRIDRDDEDRA
jgi:AbrB family looped-hinge helix DNA binding protein